MFFMINQRLTYRLVVAFVDVVCGLVAPFRKLYDLLARWRIKYRERVSYFGRTGPELGTTWMGKLLARNTTPRRRLPLNVI